MMLVFKRMWIQVTADKRRFSAFCIILGLGLLLWARLIVIANIPKQAVADDEPEATADGTSSDRRSMSPEYIELDAVPDGDPFVISTLHFPKTTAVNVLDPDPGKSGGEAAEDGSQGQARAHSKLQALVGQFRLEAVMTGQPRMAVINGQTYRIDDQIPVAGSNSIWFKLVEVRPRSVALTYEDHRFVLNIAPPGSETR